MRLLANLLWFVLAASRTSARASYSLTIIGKLARLRRAYHSSEIER